MFGSRRRRAVTNPTHSPPPVSASAATAAAQAFLSNQVSNASLSSAAAAAALKSRPTTPTQVADIQTKRTIRRAGSTSSVGSSVTGSAPPVRPTLERRASTSSMTERTFREPSPLRSAAVPSAPDAPPVPAIPKHIRTDGPMRHSRRAASIDATPTRMASPPPHPASGRGASLGPAIPGQAPRRPGHRASQSLELTGTERRGSVNFSYPTYSRPNSTMASMEAWELTSDLHQRPVILSSNNQNLVYDPNTRSFLPASELWAIEQRVQGAASKPVKKMKKVAPKETTGMHLAAGTVGGRPRGTEVDAMEKAAAPITTTSPPISPPTSPPRITKAQSVSPETTPVSPPKSRKKKAIISDSASEQGSYMSNASDAESESSIPSYAGIAHRPAVPLQKRPSVVHEDREREEAESDGQTQRQKARVEEVKPTEIKPVEAVPRLVTPEPRRPPPTGPVGISRDSTLVQPVEHPHGADSPKVINEHVKEAPAARADSPSIKLNGTAMTQRENMAARVHSVSPPRTHFAKAPDSLLVVHNPPPRSVSPRKSAMKNSNSPRTMSPAAGSDGRGSSIERSASGMDSDEQTIQRKKSVRVSFDESSNVVLGRSGSPISPESPASDTPHTKRSWFGFGRKKGKDMPHMEDDEDDEVMKPRPALPSFGSVRERKPRETIEDRPLVKPPPPPVMDSAGGTPPLSTEHSNNSKESLLEEEHLGQSKDHAIGGILAHDFATKEETHTTDPMEPLPPQVTSVEGTGYVSDDGSSTLSVDERRPEEEYHKPGSIPDVAEPTVDLSGAYYGEERPPLSPVKEEAPTTPPGTSNGMIPQINVLQASPVVGEQMKSMNTPPGPNVEEDTDSGMEEWVHVPGEWGDGESIYEEAHPEPHDEPHAEHTTTPATTGVAEPPVDQQEPSVPISYIPATIAEETEDTDGSSIYSDAAEDLSDLQGGGFMSLDAIVDTPIDNVNNALPGLAITTPPDSPAVKLAAAKQRRREDASQAAVGSDWDKAQQYWSSLSAEKRRKLELQMQRQAQGEPGETSGEEEEEKPVPKPKKKTKTKAPAPQTTSQPTTQPPRERSYMIQPGSKAAPEHTPVMRTSMRAEPQGPVESHMRSSMRSERPERPMRASMRTPPPQAQQPPLRGALQKRNRPTSYPGPESTLATSAAASSHTRNTSAAPAPAAKPTRSTPSPTLRRKGSADSESSFKRVRPSNEGMGMRRTMRGSVDLTKRAPSPMGSGQYSLRSISPTEPPARRPFGGGGGSQMSQGTMRRSMRDSYNAPTLRGSPQQGSKSGILGFGRSTKPSKTKASGPRASRFGDSSDEEDAKPAFSSRFVDSSDESEDEAAPPPASMPRTMRSTPLVPIPQRAGVEDGDSSDLPDSDDEKRPQTRGSIRLSKARQTNGNTLARPGTAHTIDSLRRSGSGREAMGVTASATRPSKGGFMSSILRRKKLDPESKVHKIDMESAARRDTPLERSKSDLAMLKYGGDPVGNRVYSPKLQKRQPSDSWPLPNEPSLQNGAGTARPGTATADGGAAETNGTANVMGERPSLAGRRFTSTGLISADSANNLSPGRKKKKFPTLRKMFGLDE
ncbi:hypothetical protein F5884DRAFT_239338 [Xylogone sp. PMI_703]|nr:hypothetical protein F5884DRAFT_239338 [Xylogone sp. PMI_703]